MCTNENVRVRVFSVNSVLTLRYIRRTMLAPLALCVLFLLQSVSADYWYSYATGLQNNVTIATADFGWNVTRTISVQSTCLHCSSPHLNRQVRISNMSMACKRSLRCALCITLPRPRTPITPFAALPTRGEALPRISLCPTSQLATSLLSM